MQFRSILGQKDVKSHFIREIQEDKVSHAQLILGKPGADTLGLALAKVQYLFCENKLENDSCGECASCKKVQLLQHPDLHFTFPVIQSKSKNSDGFLKQWREKVTESTLFSLHDWWKKMDEKGTKPIIGSEESNAIIKKMSLRSFEGGYKVLVIWQAELMNETCANKLLKLLEEPPAKTLFLLIAENSDRILPTILSRTQLVRVPAYSLEEVASYLQQQGGSWDVSHSIAARAEGDLTEAMEIFSNSEDAIMNRELFILLMRTCFKKDVNGMLDWVGAIGSKSREEQKVFVDYALHMIRQSLLKNYTQEMLVKVSQEEMQFLQNFSRFITNNNAFDFMDMFSKAHYYLDRNAYGPLLFTQLCFQVMRFIQKA